VLSDADFWHGVQKEFVQVERGVGYFFLGQRCTSLESGVSIERLEL
jgi:hypothetical protein